ncbi:hypothetical protein NDU88_003326 [Pleurodeles waltl]|uniref:Uncharacterized protein n=1 Tax=Pleurodeles waltl TaxID=8319 RepID=A0AAV7NL49_PLEWA|nr:hypothetical protein NDU88_003326 [Pleurodeles waltl]
MGPVPKDVEKRVVVAKMAAPNRANKSRRQQAKRDNTTAPKGVSRPPKGMKAKGGGCAATPRGGGWSDSMEQDSREEYEEGPGANTAVRDKKEDNKRDRHRPWVERSIENFLNAFRTQYICGEIPGRETTGSVAEINLSLVRSKKSLNDACPQLVLGMLYGRDTGVQARQGQERADNGTTKGLQQTASALAAREVRSTTHR